MAKVSAKVKTKKKVSAAYGWGIKVGGARPYIAYLFDIDKAKMKAEISQKYHKLVRVKMTEVRTPKQVKP